MKRTLLLMAAIAMATMAHAQGITITAADMLLKMRCPNRNCVQTFAESRGYYFRYEEPADVANEVVLKYTSNQKETVGGVATGYYTKLNVQLSPTGVSVITVITSLKAEQTKLVEAFKAQGFYATDENVVEGIYTMSYYSCSAYPAFECATNTYPVEEDGVTTYNYMVIIYIK